MPPILESLMMITFVIIVLPSIITILFRWALYQYLQNLAKEVQRLIHNKSRGLQETKIIATLERRFQRASSQLDQVNTAALIDQVYSQEKIKIFSLDQIDYFCRIMPNLLLAFGLIGTFFGITFNLYTLSQAINQTNAADISGLVEQLKKPLEGMSIAFVTSLTGLFFSAFLTIVNFKLNTGALKYQVLSSLEDYLDNIYLPQVQGDNRLDKIVNKMVSQQDEFLTRFGDTVRDAVEKSMGKVAQQIAAGNQEVTDLARQVYERFTDAAGTISAAASQFETAIYQLNAKLYIFKESAEIFERSQFPEKLSAATTNLTQTQERFSASAASLANTTQSLETFVIAVQELGAEIKVVNQTSSQVLELHQVNQNSLSEIIPQLQQGANSFRKAVNRLDKLEHNIIDKSESLQVIAAALQELIDIGNSYAVEVNLAITNLSQQIDGNHQNLSELMASGNSTLATEYQTMGNLLLTGVSKQTAVNQDNLQNINTNLQECIQHLNDAKHEIYRWRQQEKTLPSAPPARITDSFTHT